MKLTTPARIQRFLEEEVAYNTEPGGPSCMGPRWVLAHRRAHCMEGALFGAAWLRKLGYPPLVVDLEAVRDTDHVIAVFRERGGWGAIAKSNYSGLSYREPVYRSIRELAMSYFELYFNPAGEKTLRTVSRPVNLKRFDHLGWDSAAGELWAIPEYLCTISHTPLITKAMARHLSLMSPRQFAAGKHGALE